MGLTSKPQIQLLLSEKTAPPKNLQNNVIKYEFSKPYSEPEVQWHMRKSYNAKELNSDLVGDNNLATDLGPNYVPPCLQLTNEADLWIAKEEFLQLCKITTNKCMI